MRLCTCSLPGPIRVVRENGVHYLLADDIDNRPQGVQYYEVAPKILKRVNGLARVTNRHISQWN